MNINTLGYQRTFPSHVTVKEEDEEAAEDEGLMINSISKASKKP